MRICVKCGNEKDLGSFSLKDSKTQRRRTECKECMKAYSRERYANSDKAKNSVRRSRKSLVERNLEYARSKLDFCVDCGNDDKRVLEFDHITSDKVSGVMQVARAQLSLSVVQEEIDKCEVRCLNCHRIKTYTRANWTWADSLRIEAGEVRDDPPS